VRVGGTAAGDSLAIPGGGRFLGLQRDLGAVLAGQIGLNRKGFRLTKKPSMEPRAAGSGFFGWFAPEENQKFSEITPRKMAAAAFSGNKQQGGGLRARPPLRRGQGAAEEERAGRWEGEADRWEGGG
jgi:hypothetical protein